MALIRGHSVLGLRRSAASWLSCLASSWGPSPASCTSRGISLNWLFLLMGILIGPAVPPLSFAVTWSKASRAGAHLRRPQRHHLRHPVVARLCQGESADAWIFRRMQQIAINLHASTSR